MTISGEPTAERLARAFLAAPNGLVVVDATGTIVHANHRALEFMQHRGHQLVGKQARDVVDPEDFVRNIGVMRRLWSDPGTSVVMQLRLVSAHGELIPAEVKAHHDPTSGDVVMYVEDLHEKLQVQGRLEVLARYDVVTGLLNRRSITDRITELLGGAGPIAVLAVDVDRFQGVNDRLGHEVGDLVLAAVGERLGAIVGHGNTGRLGADEFVAVTSSSTTAEALAVAETLQAAAAEEIEVAGRSLRLTVTVGVALSGGRSGAEGVTDGTAPGLIQRAEIALHRARARGRSADVAEVADVARVVHDLELETALTAAVHEGDLDVHYQPLFDAAGRAVAVEALVRWPGSGVSASQVVEAAERSSLVVRLGAWVLDRALAELPRLSAAAGRRLRVNINWSARRITGVGLVDMVVRACERHGVDPSQVCIELTETAIVLDHEATIDVLRELRAHGVRISIDDFGIGYSSFAYLRDLPVDEVKLDRTFVQRAGVDAPSAQILEGMARLSRGLGLEVVGEGVENEHELDVVRDAGCTLWQGYLGARPASVDELLPRLAAAVPDDRSHPTGAALSGDADQAALAGVRALLGFDHGGLTDAVRHLLTIVLDAVDGDAGMVWMPDTGVVATGLRASADAGADLGRIVRGGPRCVHRADPDDLPGVAPEQGTVAAWMALPLSHGQGAILATRTSPVRGGFDGRAQHLARTLVDSSDVLLRSVAAREQLHREVDRATTEARTDALTGLANRNGWEEALARRRPLARPTGVVVLDVNQFKQVNDRHGHHVGDEALRRIAAVICESVGGAAVIARTGGDEFAALLPDADRAATARAGAALVRGLPVDLPGTGEAVTAAVGTHWAASGAALDDAIAAADQAMYAAKAASRHHPGQVRTS